ncbi:10633_t:CDS:10, partial [Ambispora gerdemannii]
MAAWMMSPYGGAVPAGSLVAILQSAGAAGLGASGVLTASAAGCGSFAMQQKEWSEIVLSLHKTRYKILLPNSKCLIYLCLCIWTLLVFNFCGVNASAKTLDSPSVETWLKTSWDAPNLLLEIVESVAAENSSAYFPYITELLAQKSEFDPSSLSTSNSSLSPKEIYTKAIKILKDSQLLSFSSSSSSSEEERRITTSLLEFSLSLHSTAPTIQAFYQYFNTAVLNRFHNENNSSSTVHFDDSCEVWVDWHGHQVCTAEEFRRVAGINKVTDTKYQLNFHNDDGERKKPPELFPFDHILQSSRSLIDKNSESAVPTIILYISSILAPEFANFHELLVKLVDQELAHYVLRYMPPPLSSTLSGDDKTLYLAGYGVELALKNTDYLVIDDRKVETADDEKASKTDAESVKESSSASDTNSAVIKQLKVDEIKDLGIKATQFILSSQNPISTLVIVAQDFPMYSHIIATKLTLGNSESLVSEIQQNQQVYVAAGANAFWLNGMTFSIASVDPFSLLRMLRREQQTVFSLKSLGLSFKKSIDLLTSPILVNSKPTESITKGMFDVRDKSKSGTTAVWWNDLEKDERYADWPSRIREILRPVFPGQLHYLRKNLFSVLYVVDLSTGEGLRLVDESNTFVNRDLPIRFGTIPLFFNGDHQSDSYIMAKLFYYTLDRYDRASVLLFFAKVREELIHTEKSIRDIARKEYEAIFKKHKPKTSTNDDDDKEKKDDDENNNQFLSFDEIINDDNENSKIGNEVRTQLRNAADFMKRFNLLPEIHGGDGGVMFVNGKYFEIDQLYQRNLLMTISEHTQFIQQKVYHGHIDDTTNIHDFLLSLPNVPSRRNPHIFVTEAKPLKVLNLVTAMDSSSSNIVSLNDNHENNIQEGRGRITSIDDFGYIVSEKNTGDSTSNIPISVWIIADFETLSGIQQGLEALLFLENFPNVRLTLLHNPSSSSSPSNSNNNKNDSNASISTLIYSLLHDQDKDTSLSPQSSSVSHKLLKEIFEEAINNNSNKNSGTDEFSTVIKEINTEKITGWQTIDRMKSSNFWHGLYPLLKNSLKLAGGDIGIVVNGRIIGPLSCEEIFTFEDLVLLIDVELAERLNPFLDAVSSLNIIKELEKQDGDTSSSSNSKKYSDFIMKASSIISASTVSDVPPGIMDTEEMKRDRPYLNMSGKYSRLEIGNIETALFQIGVILDPVSEVAQKWSIILKTLTEIEGVHIYIYLNPHLLLMELPLKRFYRYVLETKMKFDINGNPIPPSALFNNLPEDPLLTLGLDTIQAWLVTLLSSVHDLDNIKLKNLDPSNTKRGRRRGVESIFELKNLLIEGHARDITSNKPPGGLQLVLGTKSKPALVDTIVMANLGYFQLKANPGVWILGLREGRSTELFEVESVGSEGWYSRTVDEIGSFIFVYSFEGGLIYPRVKRKPGKEREEILVAVDNEGDVGGDGDGLWGYIKSKFSHTSKHDHSQRNLQKQQQKAVINIFSVASGHLYERFLSIMIVSVLQHTDSRVKFWFIENFLSSSFKNFIPHMAQEYNFDYELVTYKWPHWLRGQTEKQRTIWGYKILFLDVLFPLDLDKVIFVDADQIVRTDLKELVDMDLHGAPYGYTPFCDNRPEMDGFRFWKEGYWKEHLQGKPYHISALYVIDLHRFRVMAAGDRLRGQYQSLSADPNSLANLDQDLPNNMQHVVPIFSLPQEWLWCETWCSDESLAKAKTIDLCNNPMTKEPKLDRAKRQVPEWETYDNEVAEFASKIAAKYTTVLQKDEKILTSTIIPEPLSKDVNEEKMQIKDQKQEKL